MSTLQNENFVEDFDLHPSLLNGLDSLPIGICKEKIDFSLKVTPIKDEPQGLMPFKHFGKEFADIPVSPDLKQKVRQRLFSLINSIDGYSSPKKDLATAESLENNWFVLSNNHPMNLVCSANRKLEEFSGINNESTQMDLLAKIDYLLSSLHKLFLIKVTKVNKVVPHSGKDEENVLNTVKALSSFKNKIQDIEKMINSGSFEEQFQPLYFEHEETANCDVQEQLVKEVKCLEEELESSKKHNLELFEFFSDKFSQLEQEHKSYFEEVTSILNTLKLDHCSSVHLSDSLNSSIKGHQDRNEIKDRANFLLEQDPVQMREENEQLKSILVQLEEKIASQSKLKRSHCNSKECHRKLKAIEKLYEGLLQDIEDHYDTQIIEYQKAVNILKKRKQTES